MFGTFSALFFLILLQLRFFVLLLQLAITLTNSSFVLLLQLHSQVLSGGVGVLGDLELEDRVVSGNWGKCCLNLKGICVSYA